jgi:hypothetical protein
MLKDIPINHCCKKERPKISQNSRQRIGFFADPDLVDFFSGLIVFMVID